LAMIFCLLMLLLLPSAFNLGFLILYILSSLLLAALQLSWNIICIMEWALYDLSCYMLKSFPMKVSVRRNTQVFLHPFLHNYVFSVLFFPACEKSLFILHVHT
jgi:hypothetical protein